MRARAGVAISQAPCAGVPTGRRPVPTDLMVHRIGPDSPRPGTTGDPGPREARAPFALRPVGGGPGDAADTGKGGTSEMNAMGRAA